MLPLPNLDDRTFKQMIEEARRVIPTLSEQWTDENYHDPGITFIELFAWITEMQQYYLNQVTDKNELKFLKLLGNLPRQAVSARTNVTFQGMNKYTVLPKGTKVLAQDVIFETEEKRLLIPPKIEKVIVHTDTDFIDYSSVNMYENVSYYAFGHELKKGNTLFIGFDKELPLNQDIPVMFNLYDDYPVKKGKGRKKGLEIIPPGKLMWRYYGMHNKAKGWHSLNIVDDKTNNFMFKGFITFNISEHMEHAKINPANDKARYWISCTVEEEGYELSPKIETIRLNSIPVKQVNTLSKYMNLSSNGQPNQKFELSDYIQYYGVNIIQIQQEDGSWVYWNEIDKGYKISRDTKRKILILTFGDGVNGEIPPKGISNIRIISYDKKFEKYKFIGNSNGLSKQALDISRYLNSLKNFEIQIGTKDKNSDEYLWRDWKQVKDFDASNPWDLHYMIDKDEESMLFGNNEKGAIPIEAFENNICIISFSTCEGEKGNINKNYIDEIIDLNNDFKDIGVENYYSAIGGRKKETLEEAKLRIRKELKVPYRAITSEDYEKIVLNTPGLRVARVKAIPLYEPGLDNYPHNKRKGCITVVAVPYSEDKKPIPSEGFLKTVKKYLNKHRLITTEIHVIPPQYIEISVKAIVVISSHSIIDFKKIKQALEKLLNPIDKEDPSKGWPFGRTVFKGDIYSAIDKVKGVEYVNNLWINVQGHNVKKNSSGDIEIPPYGLVYSGEHEIEIISQEDL